MEKKIKSAEYYYELKSSSQEIDLSAKIIFNSAASYPRSTESGTTSGNISPACCYDEK